MQRMRTKPGSPVELAWRWGRATRLTRAGWRFIDTTVDTSELQAEKPSGSLADDPRRWLTKIAENVVIDFLRKETRQQPKLSLDTDEGFLSMVLPDSAPSVEEMIEQQDPLQKVQLAFSHLSESDRSSLTAHFSRSRRGPIPHNIRRIVAVLQAEIAQEPDAPTERKGENGRLSEHTRGTDQVPPKGPDSGPPVSAPGADDDPNQFPPKLHSRYREVQCFSYVELARRLDIEEENLRVLLCRARKRRAILQEEQEQKRADRRSRNLNGENLQMLLSGDPFFQLHFYAPYASILRLAYGERYTDEEISTCFGIPLGTVKSRLALAVSYLNSFRSSAPS